MNINGLQKSGKGVKTELYQSFRPAPYQLFAAMALVLACGGCKKAVAASHKPDIFDEVALEDSVSNLQSRVEALERKLTNVHAEVEFVRTNMADAMRQLDKDFGKDGEWKKFVEGQLHLHYLALSNITASPK